MKRDRWTVNYRDHAGVQRSVTCPTRQQAEELAAEKVLELGQAGPVAVVDPNITLQQYAERFLRLLPTTAKPATVRLYASVLAVHVLPALGCLKVRQLHQGRLRNFMAEKAEQKASPGLLHSSLAALSSLLKSAVDDGVLRTNPAIGLRRRLRIFRDADATREDARAMTREQLAKFLEAARAREPGWFPLFLLLARTELRLGEALALQWPDIDLRGREVRVRRTLALGAGGTVEHRLGTPNSGKARTVDLSRELSEVLRQCQQDHRLERLRLGWTDGPAWVFTASDGTPVRDVDVRRGFARTLKAAELPEHFTPHSLRHSFVVQLIQANVPLLSIQAQAGHSSIQMTVNVYGRWLPTGDKALVDRLDTLSPAIAIAAANHAPGFPTSGDHLVTNSRNRELPFPQLIDSARSDVGLSPSPQLTAM